MTDNCNSNAEITTPIGSVKFGGKRTAEMITVFSLVVLGILSYTVYMMYGTMQGVSGAIRDLASAQRELTCIISRPEQEREREYLSQNGFCKQIGRMP